MRDIRKLNNCTTNHEQNDKNDRAPRKINNYKYNIMNRGRSRITNKYRFIQNFTTSNAVIYLT